MERKDKMLSMYYNNYSYQSIGAFFGVSRQRVHQIIKNYSSLNGSSKVLGGTNKRDKVLIKYKHCCCYCGSTNILEIHHLDNNCKNNNIDNLILLCKNCHTKTHKQRRELNIS